MTAWKKSLKIAGNIVFVMVLILMFSMVGLMVKGKLDGGVPSLGPYQLYVVLSGSMSPVFDTGSMIAVQKINPTAVNLEDIITYRSSEDQNMIITHRVKGIMTLENGQLGYLTQGDANNAPDKELVLKENLIGKAVYWVPYAGYVTEFAKSKKGILIMIIIPGVLIIGNEIWRLFRYAAQYDAEEKKKRALAASDAKNEVN